MSFLGRYTDNLDDRQLKRSVLDIFKWSSKFLHPLHISVQMDVPVSQFVSSSGHPSDVSSTCKCDCISIAIHGNPTPVCDFHIKAQLHHLQQSSRWLSNLSTHPGNFAADFVMSLCYLNTLPPTRHYKFVYDCHQSDYPPYKLNYNGISKRFEPLSSFRLCTHRSLFDFPCPSYPLLVLFQAWHRQRQPPAWLHSFAREAGCIIALAQGYFRAVDASEFGMPKASDVCKPYIVSVRPENVVVFATAEVLRSYVDGIKSGVLECGVAMELVVSRQYRLEMVEEREAFALDFGRFLREAWKERLQQMPRPPVKKLSQK